MLIVLDSWCQQFTIYKRLKSFALKKNLHYETKDIYRADKKKTQVNNNNIYGLKFEVKCKIKQSQSIANFKNDAK